MSENRTSVPSAGKPTFSRRFKPPINSTVPVLEDEPKPSPPPEVSQRFGVALSSGVDIDIISQSAEERARSYLLPLLRELVPDLKLKEVIVTDRSGEKKRPFVTVQFPGEIAEPNMDRFTTNLGGRTGITAVNTALGDNANEIGFYSDIERLMRQTNPAKIFGGRNPA